MRATIGTRATVCWYANLIERLNIKEIKILKK